MGNSAFLLLKSSQITIFVGKTQEFCGYPAFHGFKRRQFLSKSHPLWLDVSARSTAPAAPSGAVAFELQRIAAG
jgi:hypothetical protein